MNTVANRSAWRKKNRNKLIFYSIFILIPVVHFLIFYVYINFNSFIMAFRNYKLDAGAIVSNFHGFENFKTAWQDLFVSKGDYVKNSIILFLVNIGISTPLALLFAFYLYKKGPMTGFFKVILFMPQVLSTVIIGTLYRYITGEVYQEILYQITGTFPESGWLDHSDPNVVLWATIFYNILMSFGVNVLVYEGSMSGINPSLIESVQLDGANVLQEFIYIVLPGIYATISTLLLVSLACMFTDQFHMYTLFKGKVSFGSVGYYIYVQAEGSSLVDTGGFLSYQVLSALGLILTAIILPTSMLIRWAMNKYGPSTD